MSSRSRQRMNRLVAMAVSLTLVLGMAPAPTLADEAPAEPAEEIAAPADELEAPAAGEAGDDVAAVPAEAAEAPATEPEATQQVEAAPAPTVTVPEEEAGESLDEADSAAPQAIASDDAAAEGAAADSPGEAPEAAGPSEAASPAFRQSATVGGVTVTVEAGAGAFPEGARLSVKGVPSSRTEAAVAAERDAGQNVAASYTFDIKVLGADGTELQPAGGMPVRVSFKAAEVADPNLDVSVYHVSGGEAEGLAVSESGTTATATSDGFSYYTVEFTYGDLQYVLQGGESIPLADVLAEVGLEGEPTSVEVSDPQLFSASDATGAWVVTSHAAFSSDEWMRVTIAGKPYEIAVTDAQDNKCGDNLTWTLDEDGTLTISGEGEMYDYDWNDHPAPWYDARDSINAVVIGKGVTSIGSYAFYLCSRIASVTIPNSVTSIGENAFASCSNLASVAIPDGVTSIGDLAFSYCHNLANVTIPDSVTYIGIGAFIDCSQLTDVYYTGTEDQWNSVRKEASWNELNPEDQQVHFVFRVAAEANPEAGGSVTLEPFPIGDVDGVYEPGTDVIVIAEPASGYIFVNWTEGETVVANSPSYGITDSANHSLTANFANGKCGENLYWTLDNGTLTISGEGDMYDYSDYAPNRTPFYDFKEDIKALVVEGGATSIGSYAFYTLTNLESATVPASVKTIGERAFDYCTGLKSVEFGNNSELTSIGDWAFANCQSLGSVEIPANVESIGYEAFIVCSSLTSVTIPSSVRTIGDAVFVLCDSLVDIYVDNLDDGTVTTPYTWGGRREVAVHWRHVVATAASPAAGGRVENVTTAGGGPYWDKDPGTKDPTVITVEASANDGYVLASVVATWRDEDGNERSATLTEDQGDPGRYSLDMPNADVTVTGYFKVPLTITAVSASKVYDGTTLTKDSYTSTALAAGDRIESVTVTGSQTVVGSSDNVPSAAKIVNTAGEDVTAKYVIAYKKGTLEVTRRAVTVAAGSSTKSYDGAPLSDGSYTSKGLAEGDSIKSVTVSGSQTVVGSSGNVPSAAKIVNTAGEDVTSSYAITYANGTLEVTKANSTVTVTGNKGTETYSGEEQKVEGYKVDISNKLYTEGDFTFSGKAVASAIDVGVTSMGLAASQFANTNPNFDVKFNVTDGSLEIEPLKVTVTITGNTGSKAYSGSEQTVEGYSVSVTNPLYKEDYIAFSGEAVARGTDSGTYCMGLSEDQFANTNDNFDVTFEVTDGSLTVEPLAVTVTIAGSTGSKAYSGSEQMVEGYAFSADKELYTEDYITFSGEAVAKGTDVAGSPYAMGLSKDQFANANDNFDVTFEVTDGSLTVEPLAVTVTITGNKASKAYTGKELTVEGYTVSASDPIYTEDYIAFSGTAVAKGTDVGTYAMGLAADQFANTNANFDVTFSVTDGSLEVFNEEATLTFDLAGGTLDGRTGKVVIAATVGRTIRLPKAPTREGYTFRCWRGSEYAAGAAYRVEGDHAFTAEWVANGSGRRLPQTGDLLAMAPALPAALGSLSLIAGAVVRRRRRS